MPLKMWCFTLQDFDNIPLCPVLNFHRQSILIKNIINVENNYKCSNGGSCCTSMCMLISVTIIYLLIQNRSNLLPKCTCMENLVMTILSFKLILIAGFWVLTLAGILPDSYHIMLHGLIITPPENTTFLFHQAIHKIWPSMSSLVEFIGHIKFTRENKIK